MRQFFYGASGIFFKNHYQKNYPSLFAPPVNQEITIDDKAMAKALLEKLGIKAQINWGADTWSDCNIYTAADTARHCIIGML